MFISGDRMHSSLRSGNFILFSCKHTLPQKLFSESGEVTFSSNWYHRSISINVYINCIICNSLIQDFDRINWIELNYHTITDMPGVIPTGWGNNHGSKLIKVWYPNDIGLYWSPIFPCLALNEVSYNTITDRPGVHPRDGGSIPWSTKPLLRSEIPTI